MSYSRTLFPLQYPTEHELTSSMAGIGMNFASLPSSNPNIEDTLLYASIDGMDHEDLRTLSILTNWMGVHFGVVNVDRLKHIVEKVPSERVKAYWASIARWLQKDRRFIKMTSLYAGERIPLLSSGTDFQISRVGEDERFLDAPLRVPSNALRRRSSDILAPKDVACMHDAYRWRVTIGPTYRADMWAELEKESDLSTSELARKAYGSFATAWKVKKDWNLVRAPESR